MKKPLWPIVLILLMIAMLTTGSVALYSQTEVLSGNVSTQIFAFNANEKATTYDFGLNGLTLQPGEGEKELYRFTLTNAKDDSSVCDYDLSVSISSSGMAAATSAMKGLTFYLYNLTSGSTTPIATLSSGEMAVSGIVFNAGVKSSREYKITAVWNDNGDSAAQTSLASSGNHYPITISLSAQTDF